MKNLLLDNPVDEHLKPVKDSDGTSTAVELSTDKIRVKDLEVTGTTTGISASDDTKLPLAGGTMTGNVDFGDNDITNIDSLDADKLSIAGGTEMTGFIDADDMSTGASATTISSSESIKAYVDAVPTNIYSKTLIKVMPNEFLHNDDRGVRSVEDDTSNTLGMRSGHSTQEQYAFIRIPEGYKATHCQVLASASTSNAVTCKTFNYTTGATTDLVTFDLNTNENITDVTASTTNDLVIKLTLASTSTIVYGAKVTIASV